MFGPCGTSMTERYQPETDEIAFRKSDMELSRTAGHASNYRSFRTSSQTGVGIPIVIVTMSY